MPKTFESLRYRNYRLWFTSVLISGSGVWMQRVAQDWLVLTILTRHSGFAVGITTALQFGPQLIFSPLAGILADRVNPRRLIQIAQSVVGLCALTMGVLVLSGVAQLWHIYALAFIAGTADTLASPSRQTFVSELVPPANLPNAVGLNSAAFNIARMIGPALAGFTIAAVGTGWVFLGNSLLFIVPILALALVRSSELRPLARSATKKGAFREGLAYVHSRTDIKLIILIVAVASALGMNFQLTTAVMATQVFHKGPGEFGLLGSIMALGSLMGALMAARRPAPRVRLVVGSAIAFGALEGLCALAPNYLSFALLLIPTGFALLTLITAANSAIQISTDEEVRGRVMSIYLLFFLGATPFGSPLIGWIAQYFGARWSLGIGGISSLLVALGAAWWAIRAWDVEVARRGKWPFIYSRGPRERSEDDHKRDEINPNLRAIIGKDDNPRPGVDNNEADSDTASNNKSNIDNCESDNPGSDKD